MALQAQYLWQSRCNSIFTVSSLLFTVTDGTYLCIRMSGHFCMYQVCLRELYVLPHNQYTAAAQQQYNGSRASRSSLCASMSRCMCVCGWRTAGDRTATALSHPMQQPKTVCRTSYQVHEAYSKSKIGSPYISLERLCSPCYTYNPPRDIKPTPSRRGTLYIYCV